MTSEKAKELKVGDLVTVRKKEYKGLIFEIYHIDKDNKRRPSDWSITVKQPNVTSKISSYFTYKTRAQDMDPVFFAKEE